MAVTRLVLNRRGIDRLLDHVTETELSQRADLVVGEARRTAPRSGPGTSFPSRSSGTLANSIHKEFGLSRTGRKLIRIVTDARNARGQFYGQFVVRGTRPHIIKARNAPRLKFFWIRAQKPMSIVQVSHPGTAPNDFLRAALRRIWR